MELSVAATEEVLRERAGIERHWHASCLERARLSAERIERPVPALSNPRTDWWGADTSSSGGTKPFWLHRQLEEEYRRFQQAQPKVPTATELQQLRTLAANLPASAVARSDDVHPSDPSAEIIRIVVQEVLATTEAHQRSADPMRITWVGGHVTEHQARRRVSRYEQLIDFPQLGEARLRELQWAANLSSSDRIA